MRLSDGYAIGTLEVREKLKIVFLCSRGRWDTKRARKCQHDNDIIIFALIIFAFHVYCRWQYEEAVAIYLPQKIQYPREGIKNTLSV